MSKNELADADEDKILTSVAQNIGRKVQDPHQLYGGGQASVSIVQALV